MMTLFLVFSHVFDDIEDKIRKIFQKKVEKIWRFKNNAYLCSPFERKRSESSLKRLKESTRSKYREKQFIEKR